MPSSYAKLGSSAGKVLGSLFGGGDAADLLKYETAGATAGVRQLQGAKYSAETQKILAELERAERADKITGAQVAGDLGIPQELYDAARMDTQTGGQYFGDHGQQLDESQYFDEADRASVEQGINLVTQAPEGLTPEVKRGQQQADLLVRMNQLSGGNSNVEQMMDALLKGQQVSLGRGMEDGSADPENVAAILGALGGKAFYGQGSSGVLNEYTGDIAPTEVSRAAAAADRALATKRSTGGSSGAMSPSEFRTVLATVMPGFDVAKYNQIAMVDPAGADAYMAEAAAGADPADLVELLDDLEAGGATLDPVMKATYQALRKRMQPKAPAPAAEPDVVIDYTQR